MKLVKNWRAVACRSFSMWANYLGIASLVAPELIFVISGRDTDPQIWFFLGLGLILAGIIGRVFDQGISR